MTQQPIRMTLASNGPSPDRMSEKARPQTAWSRRLASYFAAVLVAVGVVGMAGVTSASAAGLSAAAYVGSGTGGGGDTPLPKPSLPPVSTPANGDAAGPGVSVVVLIAAAVLLLMAIFFFLRASSKSRDAELASERTVQAPPTAITTTTQPGNVTTTTVNPGAPPVEPTEQ